MELDEALLRRLLKIGGALQIERTNWIYDAESAALKNGDDDIIIVCFEHTDGRTAHLEISLVGDENDVYFTVTSPLLRDKEVADALRDTLNVDDVDASDGTAVLYIIDCDLEDGLLAALELYKAVTDALKAGENDLVQTHEANIARIKVL